MDWKSIFLSTTFTTAAIGLICWLGKDFIAPWLTRAVSHGYDKKLEVLKADLSSKEAQIESLRAVILSNITRRQDLIFEKQIEAIEKVWSTVISLAPGKGISITLAPFKFEKAAAEAAKNPQFRQMFLLIGNDVDPKKLNTDQAQEARPFVSVLVWAYFSAYQAIIFNAVLKLHMLKTGIDKLDIIDSAKLNTLVKTALPHHSEYIEKHGDAAFHLLLDELENKLVFAFQMMLEGKELDAETLKRAALIIKSSEAILGAEQAKE